MEAQTGANIPPGRLSTTNSVAGEESPPSFQHNDVAVFVGAVANLCSATLGAGVLSLPFAFLEAGLIFGLLLLIGSAWATKESIRLLAASCDRLGVDTYEQVVEELLGKRTRKTVEISILLFCGGCGVGYIIAIGDILQKVEVMSETSTHLATILVWGLAMLPLSCLRRVQSLQCASSVGIASILMLWFAATVHMVRDQLDPASRAEDDNAPDFATGNLQHVLWPRGGSVISILRACPLIFFAFSNQVNVPQIYDELPDTDMKIKRMDRIALAATAMCTSLYLGIAVVALADFGTFTMPNILSCYTLTDRDTILHVAFIAMALAVVMAYPLNIFPARSSILQMIKSRNGDSDENSEDSSQEPLLQDRSVSEEDSTGLYDRATGTEVDVVLDSMETAGNADIGEDAGTWSLILHTVVTLAVAGTTLGLALVLPNISVVFGLLGGTTSSLLGFVVPGMLGLKITNNESRMAWFLVFGGCLVGVLTTLVTLYSTFW